MIPQRATSLLYNSIHDDDTPALHQLVEDGLHSPIQLAAISNYKLAQLTFAPPDLHSLRKTAIIKNTVSYIYEVTPLEWLDDMTRWEFFTLEALDDIGMTQEGLEKILSDYVSVMDSFKNVNVISPVSDEATQAYYDNYDNIINNNDHQEENSLEESTIIPKRSSSVSASTQPSLITETSTISSSSSSTTTMTATEQMMDIKKENKRKSFRISQQRRISWTSDTGLTSFAASQHLAGELMSLFDMEFNVEISVDPHAGTAPQLPELSYFKEKQNRNNRSSVDSFMCLIPAFESFQIDNYDGYSYVSKANKRISTLPNGVNNKRLSSSLAPTRSSSLKYKNKPPSSSTKSIHENINESYAKLNNNDPKASSSNSLLYDSQKSSTVDLQVHKTLTKKKSIRKLVSLFGKKKLNTSDPLPSESATLKSASSSNLSSSVEPISSSSLSASYSSSETNLNKPNLHVDTQFNHNNHNHSRSYNQRPANPPSLSDNVLYTNKNSSPIPETQYSPSSSFSPNSNITLEEKKRRRRSNSVPDISVNKYHQQEQQSINNQSTNSTPTTAYQKDTPTSLSSSNITLIPTSSTSTANTTSPIESNDHYLTHSKSVFEFSTVPPRRKQSLSRSPTYNVSNHSSSNNQHLYYHQHQQQHQQHDPRLYHSTHDLSKLYSNDTGGIGNVLNDSKDSVLSPNDNKKSSLMSRMTSFARRKKPTVKQPLQV